VTIDSLFPMKVFITMDGASNGVYVVKHPDSFDVIENNMGTSEAVFDFRVMAKRKGFEKLRFEVSDPPPEAILKTLEHK
jgi:hypothetical protein